MVNDQLLSQIKQQLAFGVSKDVIINNLKYQGWAETDINEAFNTLGIQDIPSNLSTSQREMSIGVSEQNAPIVNSKQANFSFFRTYLKKYKKPVLSILILIILVAFGTFAYAYYSGSFISLQSLTAKAINNIRVVNSGTYDTTISVDISEMSDITSGLNQMLSGITAPTKFTFTTKGSYDFSDTQNKKMSSVVSVDGGAFSTAGEFRIIGDTFYGQLTKVPSFTLLPLFSQYENKWFSFPIKPGDTQSLTDSFNPVSKITGGDSNIFGKMTPDQKEHLYEMFRNAHLVKEIQRFSPETISGVSCYHFSFELDQAGIIQYLESLKTYVNTIGKDVSVLSAFDPTSFSKGLDSLKDFKGEIWIGRKDNLPYKIAVNFAFLPDPTKSEKMNIDMVSIFSAWNQTVPIAVPTESTPFQELISSMMSGSLGQAGMKGQTPLVK